MTANATVLSTQNALTTNSGYATAGSVAMARLFIDACMDYRILFPAATSNDGTSTAYSIPEITAMQKDAEAFVRANASPNGRVKFLSVMDDFR